MTKADIVERIHQRIGFSKKESAEMVETVEQWCSEMRNYIPNKIDYVEVII